MTAQVIFCDLCYVPDKCEVPANVHCTWGIYEVRGEPRREPMQEADLCRKCSDQLWNRCKSAVNAGLMHWHNREVKAEPEQQVA